MNSPQQLSSISKLLASGNYQKSDVYARHIHSFRNVGQDEFVINDKSPWQIPAKKEATTKSAISTCASCAFCAFCGSFFLSRVKSKTVAEKNETFLSWLH
jgi:hypothetical protein